MPLKMFANSLCVVIDSLCQDEIYSNQLPTPPPPPSTTCQTRLYLTRQGNDGICHLCELLHNLIRLTVFDEPNRMQPPFSSLHFPQMLLAHLSHSTTGFDHTKDKLGRKVAGLNHDDDRFHLSRIVVVSVETWLTFRPGITNGPNVAGFYVVYPRVKSNCLYFICSSWTPQSINKTFGAQAHTLDPSLNFWSFRRNVPFFLSDTQLSNHSLKTQTPKPLNHSKLSAQCCLWALTRTCFVSSTLQGNPLSGLKHACSQHATLWVKIIPRLYRMGDLYVIVCAELISQGQQHLSRGWRVSLVPPALWVEIHFVTLTTCHPLCFLHLSYSSPPL